jgi:hypothetical protein
MRKNIVKPTGLKGNEKINRMKHLMGESVNKSTTNSVIELTKIGPDGKVYGIVRENHEYYIKTVGSSKKSNLVVEDFNYIGGLQNKKKEAHPTYAKAIKKLNLKFLSLNETYGGEKVNVFENDNLTENAISAGGFGFVEEEVVEEVEENDGKGTKTDNDTSGDNLDGEFDEDAKKMPGDNSKEDTGKHKAGEQGHDTEIMKEDVELSENERLIDNMVEGIEPTTKKETIKEDGYLTNRNLKISRAITIEESESKLSDLVDSLSENEAQALIEALKKKA